MLAPRNPALCTLLDRKRRLPGRILPTVLSHRARVRGRGRPSRQPMQENKPHFYIDVFSLKPKVHFPVATDPILPHSNIPSSQAHLLTYL
jgi:hypothetical protein